MPRHSLQRLWQLAGLYGVQTAYSHTTGSRQQAKPETLLAVLRLLGAPVTAYDDVKPALRLQQQVLWQRSIEPVVVSWDGHPTVFDLRLSAAHASAVLVCSIHTETGVRLHWDVDLAGVSLLRAVDIEGVTYHTKRLIIAAVLPTGYHRLTVEVGPQHFEALLIAAPQRAYIPEGDDNPKSWGLFVPSYALHSDQSWVSDDFSDLEALADWLAELGGDVIATLPLLSTFFIQSFDPSPYIPVSRLFWNEFYIDVTRAPGLEEGLAVHHLLSTLETQTLLADLRATPRVAYQQQMALKRQVLETLAEWFFAATAGQSAEFRQYVEAYPAVEDYVLLQAVVECQQAPCPAWPTRLREGIITAADANETARRYHLYAQWVAHLQSERFAARSNFCTSAGLEARQDTYIRYAAEELYAILNLESHRHQVTLVGENLGTVPPYVNAAMARHHLHRMYVVQYELTPSSQGALRPVPRHAVASMNTHDMVPFAAHWEGLDIADRLDQELLNVTEAWRERAERQALQYFLHEHELLAEPTADLPAVLSARLAFLSASESRVVLVNLEDLWLETQAQNFPGMRAERPHWLQKTPCNLEVFRNMPQLLATLRTINNLRRQRVHGV